MRVLRRRVRCLRLRRCAFSRCHRVHETFIQQENIAPDPVPAVLESSAEHGAARSAMPQEPAGATAMPQEQLRESTVIYR